MFQNTNFQFVDQIMRKLKVGQVKTDYPLCFNYGMNSEQKVSRVHKERFILSRKGEAR